MHSIINFLAESKRKAIRNVVITNQPRNSKEHQETYNFESDFASIRRVLSQAVKTWVVSDFESEVNTHDATELFLRSKSTPDRLRASEAFAVE